MSRVLGPITAIIIAAALALGVTPGALARTRDRRGPSIIVTTPTSYATTSGQLNFSGTASDRSGVAKIAVAVDAGSFALATGTTSWSQTIDTTAFADGSHILKARGWDGRGNVRTVSVSVTFSNGGSSSSSASAGPQSMVTPEGTRIDVNTSGPWTTDQIYQMLKENGLDSTVGATLQVFVQDTYPSQATASTSTVNGQTVFNAKIYLQGTRDATFTAAPDATLGHEFGHVWTLYQLYMKKHGDWSSYLNARGLAGDSRLESSYGWSVKEIIADDYRLLFGSSKAISEGQYHLNRDIPDPRNVSGLRNFLATNWTSAS